MPICTSHSTASPRNPLIYFLSLYMYLSSYISYKYTHKICGLFCPAFSLIMFLRFIRIVRINTSFLLPNSIPLFWTYHILLSHSEGLLGWFQFSNIMNNAAKILICKSLCGHMFHFSWTDSQECKCITANLCLISLRNCVGTMIEGPSLFIFLIILVTDYLFDNSHFSTYEMVVTCSLIYISLIPDDAEHNHNILAGLL